MTRRLSLPLRLAAVIVGSVALGISALGAFAAVVLDNRFWTVPLVVAFFSIGVIAWFTRTKPAPPSPRILTRHAIDAAFWRRARRPRQVVR